LKLVEERDGARITHEFEEMTPEKRPQDESGDGTGLMFETLEHGGACPDTMPQALRITDAEGRSCIYVPIEEPVLENNRPQDPTLEGNGLEFETRDHGGEYPDKMPQMIRVTDPDGRSCDYEPIKVEGRVVDSKGFNLERLD